ncbi:PREDICTED: aquaporin-9-like [Amphimedon queenslandica]|uniref:Aquaporin n=1 Tax=Amphimedon queenslandica TaxID=400682 RepID=A0A1X7VPT7_AMPQE|nr:PREDICTED: aquaporin-9-like [Amphimedon queenslandica]|eukprot:XP_011409658.1 PREDICTED: aquaporin-9-like [Amphimedon queenslandica]
MAEEKTSLLDSATSSISYSDSQGIASQLDRFIYIVTKPWKFAVKKAYLKECLAEFLGTFLLVVIGNGAIAQTLLSEPPDQFGTFRSINIGYGLALMIGIYMSAGVSGGHLNPAVTLAMAFRGKMKWLLVIPYWVSQFLGAFMSAPFIHGIYNDAINAAGGKTNATAGIFATYPAPYLYIGTGFFDQLFGTFILVIGIFAVTDSKNSEVLSGLKPFIIGLLLWAIGSSFGMNAGYAINPARDFGPRLYTAMAGWGKEVFLCDFCGNIRHWWWVPLVAPMFGGLIAAFVYWFFIDAHHPKENDGKYKSINKE